MDWLLDAWKMIQEDKWDHYRMMSSLMPLSRTPMDKKGAAALKKYERDLFRSFDKATPWREKARRNAHLRGKVEPGKVVVILDSDESPNDPLYAGATVTRE